MAGRLAFYIIIFVSTNHMPIIKSIIIIFWATGSFFALATHVQAQQETEGVASHIQRYVSGVNPGAHGNKDPHNKLSPEMHLQVALQHKAAGRMGEAFQTLDQAIALNPQSAELFAVRGSFYLENKNISPALNDFEIALKMEPDSAAILTNRAQAYRHFGRIGEAIADLDRAIELNPQLVAAYFNRGSVFYSSEEYKRALSDFDNCIMLDPHAEGPYFNRAATRDALGDRKGAIEDMNRFIELSDNTEWKNSAAEILAQWQEPGDTQ